MLLSLAERRERLGEGGAGGDAHRDALLGGHAAGHQEAVVVVDLHHLVDHAAVQDRGHEGRAFKLGEPDYGRLLSAIMLEA